MEKPLKLVAEKSVAPSDIPSEMWFRSCCAWYTNESHRLKWLTAVQYLRTTKKGWIIEKLTKART